MREVVSWARGEGRIDVFREAFEGPCQYSEECRDCVALAFNHQYMKWLWMGRGEVFLQLADRVEECLGYTGRGAQ